MPDYFATCARGLERILADELAPLDARDILPGRGGVHFRGDTAVLYRASLWCRTAVRILQPLLEFDCYNPDELYDAVRSIDWRQYTSPAQTLAVDSNVRDSSITHSQYAARRVKDAICDQFRDAVGVRPSVDVEKPMLGLNLHISRDHAILSRDTSWDSLHKRGYRPVQTRAPLNEALAAGLLLASGWRGDTPLADPLCGGGTLLIEAAWIAAKRPPGLTRKWYSFFTWPDFDRGLWTAIRDDARDRVLKDVPFAIQGSDQRTDAIEFAANNARAAGVAHMIRFEKQELRHTRPPPGPPGLVIVNPPYGERIGEERELVPLYRDLGRTVADYWPGWTLAVFTMHDELARAIDMKRTTAIPFYNGSLPCKLHLYRHHETREDIWRAPAKTVQTS